MPAAAGDNNSLTTNVVVASVVDEVLGNESGPAGAATLGGNCNVAYGDNSNGE